MSRYNLFLLIVLILIGIFTAFLPVALPSYTICAIVLLLLPSVFVFMKKDPHLDKKKLLTVCFILLGAGVVWDKIAIYYKIWNFPKESVIGWLWGIPIEEFAFALAMVTITLGIYTSIHKIKAPIHFHIHHFRIITALIIATFLQFLVLYSVAFSGGHSYLKWLLILAIIPSSFYIFRRGENINYPKMILTAVIFGLMTIPYDYIFTLSQSWYHYDTALLGRIGIVPIDDILFSIFTSITIIGFYTSIPHKHPLVGAWKES